MRSGASGVSASVSVMPRAKSSKARFLKCMRRATLTASIVYLMSHVTFSLTFHPVDCSFDISGFGFEQVSKGEGGVRIDWYQADKSRNIVRHACNQRKQQSIRRSYVRAILEYGVAEGCRGECWLVERLSFISFAVGCGL